MRSSSYNNRLSLPKKSLSCSTWRAPGQADGDEVGLGLRVERRAERRIAFHFRLDPNIYYFRGGPPYGKAYGYWKKHPPRDVEVIDAVNVHFLSEYHRVAPDVVWAERSHGRSYAVVARDFAVKSGKREDHRRDDDDDDRGHVHGKGKGHER